MIDQKNKKMKKNTKLNLCSIFMKTKAKDELQIYYIYKYQHYKIN